MAMEIMVIKNPAITRDDDELAGGGDVAGPSVAPLLVLLLDGGCAMLEEGVVP